MKEKGFAKACFCHAWVQEEMVHRNLLFKAEGKINYSSDDN